MPNDFKLPDLGENIEGGDVVAILVNVGDTIKEDQPLFELETDKAVIEIPASTEGTVDRIHVGSGDHVEVGQTLITFEDDGPNDIAKSETTAVPEKLPADPNRGGNPEASTALDTSFEFRLPDLGENTEGGDVVAVLVQPGDPVTADQPLLELETDKAVIEVPSPKTGIIGEVRIANGDQVIVGQPLFIFDSSEQSPAEPVESTLPPSPKNTGAEHQAPATTQTTSNSRSPDTTTPSATVPAAPSVRRLAREIGIDITHVTGSGPSGRVSAEDIKSYSRQLNQAHTTSMPGSPKLPDFAQWGQTERQSMGKVRQVTADRLSNAWSTIPQVTQSDQADITELERLRKEFASIAEEAGGKLTITAILIKVLGVALKVFPQFNASIDMAAREVIYKKYCHIGIAVDTTNGLMVPVVRDVDCKNIVELAVELVEIAGKTRDRKIQPQEMQGGCMTISNVGTIGGTGFTPIVNPPEVAIIGVARSRTEAIFIDGNVQPRLMMPLSLSYDHRIIDGADGARFLRWVCEALETPFKLLLQS